jgi:hypothetical protein
MAKENQERGDGDRHVVGGGDSTARRSENGARLAAEETDASVEGGSAAALSWPGSTPGTCGRIPGGRVPPAGVDPAARRLARRVFERLGPQGQELMRLMADRADGDPSGWVLKRSLARAMRQPDDVEELFAELMRLEPARRLGAAEREPRFRSRALARRLRLMAESVLGDPARRAAAADLALSVAAELRGNARNQRLLVSAVAVAARARTQVGDEAGAGELWRVLSELAGGPDEDPASWGALHHGEGELLWRQGRLSEASGRFTLAAEAWSKAGEGQWTALCWAELGLVLLDAEDLAGARRSLGMAHVKLEPRVPALSSRVAMGLALCLMAAGESGPARERQRTAELLGAAVSAAEGGAGEQVLLRWRRARLAAAAGDAAAAERLLDGVRVDLLRRGSAREAVLASLDLAEVLIGQGRCDDVEALGPVLRDTFGSDGDLAAVELAVLAVTAVDCPPAVSSIVGMVRRAWVAVRSPGARPDLIRSVAALADAFLAPTDPVPLA